MKRLNWGAVPPFKMQPGGAASSLKMHSRGKFFQLTLLCMGGLFSPLLAKKVNALNFVKTNLYLNFLTFSVWGLRSFYKKLEHPMCLGLILVDVFGWKVHFPNSKFSFFGYSPKTPFFQTILRITVFHVGGYAFGF